MPPAYVEAFVAQGIPNPPAAEERVLQVQLVNAPHQDQIPLRCGRRPVVLARARELQNLALPLQRQLVATVDHHFALASSMRPSATDKKSFSKVSCPIFACMSLIVGPVSFLAPRAKTASACSANCCFQARIWL